MAPGGPWPAAAASELWEGDDSRTDAAPGGRLRVGLVGAGIIAQVMHLHYLAELSDLYDVRAVCDIAAGNARAARSDTGSPSPAPTGAT